MYGSDLDATREELRNAIFVVLSKERLEKSAILFDQGLYRASISAATIVLEHTLRRNLNIQPHSGRPLSLGALARMAQKLYTIEGESAKRFDKVVQIRNRAVHDVMEPTREDAKFVLSTVRELVEKLPHPPADEVTL